MFDTPDDNWNGPSSLRARLVRGLAVLAVAATLMGALVLSVR